MTHDFYLRIQVEQLPSLRFTHMASDVDLFDEESAAACQREGASMAQPISGFTEWLSEDQPAHSIGWDWVMAGPRGGLAIKDHTLRTNIMLVDAKGLDVGRQGTEQALLALVADWDWPAEVLASLQTTAVPGG